jgi:hypothetical protein
MLHRQAFATINMTEELQTVFQAVIGVVNWQKQPTERKTLQSYVTIWRQNTWHFYTIVKHAGFQMCQSALHGIRIARGNNYFSK